MAKKGSMTHKAPTWFGVIVTLIGIWYVLGDMGMLSTYGINLWSIVILLVGICMWSNSSK